MVSKEIDAIILNALDLNIIDAYYYDSFGYIKKVNRIELSQENETATFTFNTPLSPASKGYFNIEFEGELSDKMRGLYRSKYIGADGTVEYAAVTQFQPTDARRCFPCWDDPAIKSKFVITVVVPVGLTVLSNMTPEVTNEAYGTKSVMFHETPLMSTYLLAIVVGKFEYIEAQLDNSYVRVYTRESKKEQGEFALEVATKVLAYYNNYFEISYQLPKLDLVAIPDFSFGAMENWGLVTYRETCLLVDPKNTSTGRKQWIALVIAHELAHQWFGNLVTLEWWTHLWLNEGYASFAEYLCIGDLFPNYDVWSQFITDTHIRALELDAFQNSHPIEVPVYHPAEIDEIFDDISYSKAASVIRMIHSYVGADAFRVGISYYLTRYRYSNANANSFWFAMECNTEKQLRHVMAAWIEQQGFPVIKVQHRQEGNDRILTLSQEKFIADGSEDPNNTMWSIPINIITSSEPDSKKPAVQTLLSEKSQEIRVENVGEDDWVKLNPGLVGFYRTHYSPEAMDLLFPAVKDHTLDPLDRLGLLDDMFAMVKAGHASTVEVLKFMQAFRSEENFTVWSSIVNCLKKIGALISHLEFEDSFKAFARNLMREITDKLSWDPKSDESHLDSLLRPLILGHMAVLNVEDIIEEANKRFELHVSGKTPLAADLRSPVYRAVLSVGEIKTFETMLRLYRETDFNEEKERILSALGVMKYKSLIANFLQFAMSDEVKAQDTTLAIMSVAKTYKGREMAWEYFKLSWESLLNRYGGGSLISRLVKCITENFVTEKEAQDVEQFFKKHPIPGTDRTVQQSVESIRLNAAWLARDKDSIREYLTSQVWE
ncbi:PREDICTED: puromycin-sensitive aminopeptidase isoform X2 [Eufriesea mexicana]|uniref:puromycin-sensitive aminopeptidase isoform X2 n=1 Tax=Eufriesea mexicana TaxID=516756 RepID=UPI00083C76CA|nr:PREDICTED: puromycin-sensitive aminopeptidase isoform X2 [Eufriesea mexicana]